MARIRLVHWNAGEARERAAILESAGHQVASEPLAPGGGIRQLRDNPPDAIVIDLSRLPSHGRDVALAIRSNRPLRRMPLVFAEGDPEKVERIRSLLPDATYTSWKRMETALRKAIARPPKDPVAPSSVLAGYSGTPLVKKLGIKEAATVSLLGAPDGFRDTLGALPDGARLTSRLEGTADLILLFARSRAALDRELSRALPRIGRDGLWIIWPKKTSGMDSDLTQNSVRAIGLALGLVDYKICAVDQTWSGLKFTLRRPK